MEATTLFFECPLSGKSPTTTIDRRPASDPTISVLDSGAERGDGVFETFGVIKRNAQALDPHLERLKMSARLLDLPEPDIDELRRIVRTTAAMTGPTGEYSLKLVLTRGGPGTNGRPAAWIILSDMPDYHPVRTEGLRVILLNKGYHSSLVREEPWLLFGAKHLSYAQHMAALREARRQDSQEVVFTTADGLLLEGPTSTLIVRHGDRLLTPHPGSAGAPQPVNYSSNVTRRLRNTASRCFWESCISGTSRSSSRLRSSSSWSSSSSMASMSS